MQAKPLATEFFAPKTAEILEFPSRTPESLLEAVPEPLSNFTRIPEWTEPLSSKQIAEVFAVQFEGAIASWQRNISNWFPVICEAYKWLPETDLRFGSGKNTRYTPFCCQQFETLAQIGKDGYATWIESVHEANRDKLPSAPVSELASTDASAMVPYQPQSGEMERFTPPERKIRKYTSTAEFTTIAKQNTETALDVTQSNSESLANALINQMVQEGQKLGVTLFQAKYGTAHSVMNDLEDALAKKSGLQTEPVEPPQP